MWHRVNLWSFRLLGPVTAFASMLLVRSGFSVLKVVTIVAPSLLVLIVVLALSMIAASPGPRTKATVDQLKNRLCK
jgi:hypothetical protein